MVFIGIIDTCGNGVSALNMRANEGMESFAVFRKNGFSENYSIKVEKYIARLGRKWYTIDNNTVTTRRRL